MRYTRRRMIFWAWQRITDRLHFGTKLFELQDRGSSLTLTCLCGAHTRWIEFARGQEKSAAAVGEVLLCLLARHRTGSPHAPNCHALWRALEACMQLESSDVSHYWWPFLESL